MSATVSAVEAAARLARIQANAAAVNSALAGIAADVATAPAAAPAPPPPPLHAFPPGIKHGPSDTIEADDVKMLRHQRRMDFLLELVMYAGGRLVDTAPTPEMAAALASNPPWDGLLDAASSIIYTLSNETN